MSGLEKFKVPIIVVAILAVGAAVFAISKGGGGDAPVNDVSKQAVDVTANNRPGDPLVPENQRTGMAIGDKK